MSVITSGRAAVEAAPGLAPAGVPGPGEAVRHTLAIARRNLRKVLASPGQILDATLMPLIFALIFVYGFGGAISGSASEYRQYLMPGIMALSITIASRTSGISINSDFGNGVMDRFRSLPMAGSAVLAGRIVADTVRMLVSLLVILAFAFLIGFRVHTGVVETLGAIGLILAYGVALCWMHAYIGLAARAPETVQSVGMLAMVPFQFGSSIFADPGTMPEWLRVLVANNPMTLVVDGARNLLIGGPVAHQILGALAWSVGLTALFAGLSVWQYRRRA
ncbi:ABC transporter permease [Streptomyces sp. NPDC041068]|uniref:ABC transporter permease n=1 Tax=Streptomyces sp. NPDC041068 TaxID=3155130 RepID=UPI0033E40603